MTDYTKSTNFATKDNLSSGNPLKIVKGTEIDTEFNNIATAISTKADLASPTFTGTPTLPSGTIATTQSSGNNTTALATTAFVQAALATIYPVGSIYTATVSTNPNTLFGFGTWTAFGAGRVLIGAGTGGGATYTAGSTGGSKDAILPSHTHTFTGTALPSHAHFVSNSTPAGAGSTWPFQAGSGYATNGANTSSVSAGTPSGTNSTEGVSATDGNLQPYVVVYMWQRTA